MENQITKNGKKWELISGPWSDCEILMRDKHIKDIEHPIDPRAKGIPCTVEDGPDGTYVYRDADGYVTIRGLPKYYTKQGRPVISEFRKIQREIQASMMAAAR